MLKTRPNEEIFEKEAKKFGRFKKSSYLCIAKQNDGAIAQLVEQRTENPCVPGSIPGGTTHKTIKSLIFTRLAIFVFTHFCRVTYKVTY